jgi:hypothetical protein
MKIRILAVLQLTGLGVVSPESTSIAHAHGEPVTLSVSVQSDDGMHCNPAGRTYTLRISPTVDGAGPIYRTTLTPNAAQADWSQDIPVAIPISVPPGTYRWDLFVTHGEQSYAAVLESSWQILSSTRS